MNNVAILNQLQRRVGSANWKDWQIHRWCWYDYIRYPGAGTSAPLSFFSIPLGGTDPNSAAGKTLEQTNVTKGGGFGQTYFFIQQIRTHIFPLPKLRQTTGIPADADYISSGTANAFQNALANLAGQGVLVLTLGQKEYFTIEKPFINAPPGFGPDIDIHAQNGAADSQWFMQSASAKDVWQCTPPQMIEPEQNIQVQIEFPNAASPALTNTVGGDTTPLVDLGVILDGYIARPAQ